MPKMRWAVFSFSNGKFSHFFFFQFTGGRNLDEDMDTGPDMEMSDKQIMMEQRYIHVRGNEMTVA